MSRSFAVNAPAVSGGRTPVTAPQTKGLAEMVRGKMRTTLTGKKLDQFCSDVVSLANNNPALMECDQTSLVAACLQAQTLGLSLNKNMGQAWVVPFRDGRNGRTLATFQIGYKGYVQLAIRSGQYRKLTVLPIKEGELVRWDPLLEDIQVELITDGRQREKAPTIGYYAMFEYINGFRKAMYWSREQMEAHALQYSQSYRTDQNRRGNSSFWSKNFDSMACKTMLRQLISKWGIMSVELVTALEKDGQLPDGQYADNMPDFDEAAMPTAEIPVENTDEVLPVDQGDNTEGVITQPETPDEQLAELRTQALRAWTDKGRTLDDAEFSVMQNYNQWTAETCRRLIEMAQHLQARKGK